MLIGLLILLGVNLAVVAAIAVTVVGRRRWVRRQPGEFAGAIRVSSGAVDGLSPTWRPGSGRWVRDILVWSKAPLLYRTDLVAVDRFDGEHTAPAHEVKRLGDAPIVFEFASDGATIEVAARPEHRALVTSPVTTGSLTR